MMEMNEELRKIQEKGLERNSQARTQPLQSAEDLIDELNKEKQ